MDTHADTDIAAFADSARRAFAACAGLDGPGQAARLAEDGLLAILTPETSGGLGLGLAHAVPVMEGAGGSLLGFPLGEAMLLAAYLPQAGEAVLSGQLVATIAWAGTVVLRQGRVEGTVGRAPLIAGCAAVLVRLDDGSAALVRLADCAATPAPSLDADAPEYEIVLAGAEPMAMIDAAAAARLWSDAGVLRTAAMLGAAEACLLRAVEYVSTRQQFGRPLVSFQALRHALARQKLAVDNIRAALRRSLSLPTGAEAERARRTAFLAAARWGPAAVESALQLHGGMGFTWDVPVHRHLRQVRSWEAQGDARAVREAVADTLLEANA